MSDTIHYDKTAFELAHERMRRAPLELTETDLNQLGSLDPKLEAEGHEARRAAQLVAVRKNMPALQTKTASPVDRSQLPVTRKFLHKNLETFADQLGTVLVEVLKQTVLPLKEQIAQLNARVLELEAVIASQVVPHDR
jgi:hypothetical protein